MMRRHYLSKEFSPTDDGQPRRAKSNSCPEKKANHPARFSVYAVPLVFLFVVAVWRLVNSHTIVSTHNFSPTPKHRIIAVTYVFGEAPFNQGYFQMFLESARRSGLDIAIVGTPAPPFPLPPNVRHVPITWEQFAALVRERILPEHTLQEMTLQSAKPYKIIDFKPLFAYLFPEQVEGYDWWGHIDNDLILGDVRHFLTPEILANYDVISGIGDSPRKFRTWGPFMFYRNTNVINELFRLAELDLFHLYGDQRPLFLDEWANKKRNYFKSSMTGIIRNHHKTLGLRLLYSGLPLAWDGESESLHKRNWTECSLTFASDRQRLWLDESDITPGCSPHSEKEECSVEVLLCHFQFAKKNKSLTNGSVPLIPDKGFRFSASRGFKPLN